MQQLPEIEKVDSKNEISCLKWTTNNGRRKICTSFKADMDKFTVIETIHTSKTLRWS